MEKDQKLEDCDQSRVSLISSSVSEYSDNENDSDSDNDSGGPKFWSVRSFPCIVIRVGFGSFSYLNFVYFNQSKQYKVLAFHVFSFFQIIQLSETTST